MPHRILTAAFAACLFTLIVAAKWATFGKYGSPMPDWDQWDAEGGALFIPWHKGEDLLPHVVRPHNEHRVILTKLQNLTLGVANGQWDSRLEAATNALLHAAVAAALWLAAARWFAWPALAGLFGLLAGLFGLPLAWQNVLGGFHSQQYWLLGLSLAAIGLLPSRRPGSGGWWLGAFAAVAALGSMGSGLLAPAAVLIVLGWRLLRREETWRDLWPTLVLCAALVAAGLALRVEVEWHAHMKAKSVQDIALSLLHSLQWPWRGQHWAALVLWLPWALTAWRITFSPRGGALSRDTGGILITTLGGWVLLQLLATAYARGAGGDYPASRYMDTLAFGAAVNGLALAWLAREAKGSSWPERLATPVLIAAWALTLGLGVHVFLRDIVVHELKAAREYYDKAEGHLRRYLATNDPGFLAYPDIPYPNAQGIIDYLSNPALRTMLPAPIPPPRELEPENDGGAFQRNRVIGFNLEGPPREGLSPQTPPLDYTSTWGSHAKETGPKATGEWRSKPQPPPAPHVRWLRFETAGNLGEPGVSLQLRSAGNDHLLAEVKPSRTPGDAWRTAYVPAPREPYRVVASDRDPDRWLAFSGPLGMSGLSFLAWQATRHAPVILGGTVSVAALLAAVMLIARRRDNFLRHITAVGQPPRHRMKLPNPPALALAALFSVVFSLPFLPSARMRTDHFLLELRLSCSKPSSLQVFLDDGQGFRETLTAATAVRASTAVEKYSLPIPGGTYSVLRLDPPEGGTEITIHAMQVTTASGRVLAKIDLTNFASVQQTSLLKLAGDRLQIVSAPGSDDPQIAAKFSSPLIVHLPASEILREVAPRAAIILAGLLSMMMAVLNSSFVKSRLVAAVVWMQERPTRAIMLLAALSVAASAYPVIFSGRSFVSPNLGTNLLYDRFPTLPGYRSTAMSDPKLSDVGAVMWQHVPFSVIQHRALSQGELPLWNRYNALGVPLLGQGQSMFGDPLHFLVIAARGAAWAWDLKYLIAKWLFATGLGLAVLALVKDQKTKGLRDQGTQGLKDKGTNGLADQARLEGGSCASPPDSLTPPLPPSLSPLVPWSLSPLVPWSLSPFVPWSFGPLIVAFAAPFIGFFLYRLNHPAFFSLCYAPWPLYCLLRVASATDRRGVTLWSAGLLLANIALMNSGTVKEAYMLLLSVNFSGLCVLLASAAGWRDKLSRLGTLAWFGLLFVLITAPVWNTFLNTLRQAYTGYNAASAYQLQPSLLLGLFDEIFHRPLLSNNQVYAPSLNFLLLGGFLLFLATLRRHFTRPAVMALAASSILPLALAFGLLSPEWIVKVPFLGNIAHLDNTFSCVLIVLWTVLAGVGFAEAAGRLGTREGRDDLIIAGLLLFGLVFAWLAFGHAAHRPIYGPTFTVNQPGRTLPVDRFILDYLVVLLAALTGLAMAVHLALRRRSLTAATGLAIAGCTILLLWRHGAHDSALGFEDFVNRPARRADFHARSEAMETVRATQTTTPARGYGLHSNFFAGWTGVYELEGVHGPDALVNPFVRELMGASGVTRMWDWRLYAEAREAGNVRPFFDALNVRHYFDLASDQGVLGRALNLVRTADLDVYESPTAWPRAFFSDRVVSYATPAELAARFRASASRPFAAIQKHDHPSQGALSAVPRAEAGATVHPATGYRLTANSTSFTVRANGPGVIAVLEAHWPGDFRATINGREADVIRVNHAFNGIVVNAAGEHRVTLRYWPRDLSRDLTLAGIGLMLLAASLFLTLRRERTA